MTDMQHLFRAVALAGQFLIQSLTSFVNALIAACGLVGSRVVKSINAIGVLAGTLQAAVFTVMLVGGTWLSRRYIHYALTIITVFALEASTLCRLIRVPGKLFPAWMTTWVPHYYQASMRVPPGTRREHASQFRSQGRPQISNRARSTAVDAGHHHTRLARRFITDLNTDNK